MDLTKIRPKSIENIRFLEFEGEAIIYSYNNSTGEYLNTTATFIWKCCDGKHNLEDIEKKMLAVFDGDLLQIRTDIEEIVLRFYEAKLLEKYNLSYQGEKDNL